MSEMVERVARALWAVGSHAPFETAPDIMQDLCRKNARAAIKAMMKPTEEMIEAMPETHYWGVCPSCGGSEGAYKAMLTAALED